MAVYFKKAAKHLRDALPFDGGKMMGVAQTARHPQDAQPPSYETVWALLQEVAQSQKETDRLMKENAESQKQREREMKDYNKRFGEFTKRFGEVVEYMLAPSLREKFVEFGFNFNELMNNRIFYNAKHEYIFEVDVFLQNGEKAMLVEVKTKLRTEDVRENMDRLEKMRAYADARGDKRVFLGAVAGVIITPNVKRYALKKGLFVIEPSGETISIIPPNGQPKEW